MRKVLHRTGLALGLLAIPALASAQKALVYCPIAQDRAGCDAIVAALTGPAYPGGVDRGHDGTGGTADLRTVDLSTYKVFLVPSLADDPGSQPYAFLRDSTVAAHLKAGLIGGLAVWSGMPDQGTANRAQKDQLIRNLAGWAGASQAAAEGPGLVAFLDLSDDEGARYDWLRAITPFRVTSDVTLISYDSVRALTPTATTILGAAPGQNNYASMAVFGLATMNPTPGISLDAVGSTGTTLGGQVVLVTLAAGNTGGPSLTTDKLDYAPGDTVTFSGSGWGVGEVVTIVLHEDPLSHADRSITVVADGFGNFTDRSFAPEEHDLLVRFVATATGGTSGSRAQTTFTDSRPTAITVGAQAPASVPAGSAAIYSITVSMTGNVTPCSVSLTVTTALPAGAVASFSPNPASNTGGSTDATSTLTITTTGATPTGSSPFTVRATKVACQSGNPNFVETTSTLVVSAAPNVAPVLDPIGNQSVDEGNLLSFTATATDANPGQTRTFTLDAGAPTGALITTAGVFTWTPTEDQGPGVYPVTIRVTDNGTPSLSDTETIDIMVAEVNLAPALNAIGPKTVDEGELLSFTATAADPDLPTNSLTFSLTGTVPAGAAISSGGAFTWTPSETQQGVHSITVRVDDNGTPNLFHTETISVTVNEVNVAPVLSGVPASVTIPELAPYTFTATATDADLPAQTLTFSLSGTAPAGATINGTSGVFDWTPTEAQGGAGPYTFDVIVSDGVTTTSSSTTLTVTEINESPVLAAIGNKNADEGVLLSFTATATDGDIPANTLTFSLDAGAPTGAAITAGGAFTFTPTEAQGPGTYNVTIRVTDNGTPALDDSETIQIVVAEVNAAPVLAGVPASATIPELAPYTFTATATDADVPAQTLTFSLSGTAPSGAAIDGTSGVFTWTPTEAQGPGVYTFDVLVGDGVTSTPSTIAITVTEVNQAPVLGAIGNKNVDELVALGFTATATDPDLPAQSLTFSLDVGAPAGAAISAAGVFSWTPTEAQGPGVYPVTIRVTDNGSPALDDFETISITVAEVNVAPILTGVPASATIPELALYTFDANATDADDPAQTLTFSLSGAAPTGATMDGSTGVFSWTPTEAQGPGVYTFDVVVGDGVTTTPSSITLTVTEVNQAPVLGAIGNKAVNELVELTFTAAATDGDLPANTLTYSLVGSPAGASIHPTTGAFSWTPSELEDGIHSVTVRVSDGTDTDEETISVTVSEVNVAPTLNAIGNKNVDELVNLSFTISATDPDVVAGVPNTLTFSAPTTPLGAVFTPGTQGFSWTPTENQDGVHSASFQVSDGALTDDETISITVAEVNVAPTLTAIGSKTVDELATLTFTAAATDPDVVGGSPQTLTFSLTGSPPVGATISGAGAFSWTPAETQDGTHQVTVQVTDGAANDDELVSITVNEVNVAPTLTAIGNKNVDELVNLSFTIVATDPDVVAGVANTLTFSAPTLPDGAAFTPGTQGFSWTPTELQDGIHSTAFQVSDGTLTDGETITITVAEVNVAPTLDPIGSKSVNELVALGFTAIGSDPDVIAGSAQPVSFSLTGSPPSGAAITAVGAFTWTPTEMQDGIHPVTVQISDGVLSDNEIVSITVNEINLAPVLDAIGNQAVNELVQLTFNAAATDDDFVASVPNTKTFTLDPGAPAGAAITTAGVFTWTPTEAQGPDTFPVTVRVTDNGVPVQNDSETFNIVVAEVNLAPVLTVPATQTLNWGNVMSVSASATDPDVPANTLTFSLTSPVPAGVTIDGTSGAIGWTPTAAQIGVNTVTVRVTDNGTPAMYDEKSFTVNVNKRPTNLVYGGATAGQYSDPIAVSATLSDNGGEPLQGTAISGKPVTFTLGSQSASPTPSTNASGIASSTITLDQSPAAYTINSAFVTDASYLGSTDSDAFDITPEDARETYTGPLLISSASLSDANAYNIPLQATIRDISAVPGDPATDANGGDITNAEVTFVVRNESFTTVHTCSNLSVTLIGADPKIGTAGCVVPSLTSGGSSEVYYVEVIVNNYYTDGVSDGTTLMENMITVIQLVPGSISGGGYTFHQQSAGTYKGALGLRTNYGFTTKFNKTGKGVQGKVNIIVRGENGKKYQIKSTSVDNMALLPNGQAEFYSKANITDITNPLAPVNLGGGLSLAITLWDKGEPGSADIIGITLKNGNTLLYSSHWDGVKTVEKLIDGGNLQVRQK